MPASANSGAAEELGPFQFSLLVLSLTALAAIAADSFFRLPAEISRLLHWADNAACAAFFVDFVVRFRRAESKAAFMKWGWIDLLASVPDIQLLRLGRFVRVLRVIRLLRGIQTVHRFLAMMDLTRRRGGTITVVLAVFILVTCSSVAMLAVERTKDANIKTAGDAVWWSVTTMTTVGYGDRYPVTTAGRFIAMTLMFCGVGLFGALSGIIASNFLGQQDDQDEKILAEVQALRAEVARLNPPGRDSPPH